MVDGMISSNTFILCRCVAGTILFWLVDLLFVGEKVENKDFPYLMLLAVFGIALNQLCFFAGLELTSPIHGSLIMVLTPILVLVLSLFILKEKITLLKGAGIILGLSGAVVLILMGCSAGGQASIKGDFLILINASSYGLYLVLLKRIIAKYNVITIVKWAYTFGLLHVIPFGWSGVDDIVWSSFTNNHWIAFWYVLICTTFLAYMFNAYALNYVKPTTVSAYIYLQPFIATSISIAVGQDTLDTIKVLAASLIFSGLFLVAYRKKPVLKS